MSKGVQNALPEKKSDRSYNKGHLQYIGDSRIAGNRLGNAKKLGVLKKQEQLKGTLSQQNRNNFFQFRLNSRSRVKLNLRQLRANADLELLRRNGNRIKAAKRPGQQDESIKAKLKAGTYYVKVSGKGDRTSYRLILKNTFNNASSKNQLDLPASLTSGGVPQALVYNVTLSGVVRSFTSQLPFQRFGQLFITRPFPAVTGNDRNAFEVALLSSDVPGGVTGRGSIRFATNTGLTTAGESIDTVFQNVDSRQNLLGLAVDRTAASGSNQFAVSLPINTGIPIGTGTMNLQFQGNQVAAIINVAAVGGGGNYSAQLSGTFAGTQPL